MANVAIFSSVQLLTWNSFYKTGAFQLPCFVSVCEYRAFVHKDVAFRQYETPARSKHRWTRRSLRAHERVGGIHVCLPYVRVGREQPLAAGAQCSSEWHQSCGYGSRGEVCLLINGDRRREFLNSVTATLVISVSLNVLFFFNLWVSEVADGSNQYK